MERATQRKLDLAVAVPAEVDDRALGCEQVERPLEPGGRRAGVHDQVATVGGVGRQREVDADRGRDIGPAGIDVYECDLHRREPAQQACDAAADHPCADDGDPVAEQWSSVPQGVDGGLDGAREHGTSGRNALGHDGHCAGRHHVGSLVGVQAEDSAAGQLRWSLLHGADVEVAILDRPWEIPLLEGRPHRSVLARRHAARNTNVSVPRLTPDRRVRTITSPRCGSGSVTGRISPEPGARSQNACASTCTDLTLPDLRVNRPVAKPAEPRRFSPWYRFGTDRCVLCVRFFQKPRRIGRSGHPWKHLTADPLGWGPKGRWFKSSRPDHLEAVSDAGLRPPYVAV